jgi:hypothetical protein
MAVGKAVVRVTIVDRGGGIDRVEWWINDASTRASQPIAAGRALLGGGGA